MTTDSKSDRLYEQLRLDILAGKLRPGESLSAIRIGERFAASRTPVRQAFRRLEAEGLLSLIDRQGARVAPISIQGVRDLFELRILLESAATRMVAEAASQDPTVRQPFVQILDQLDTMAPQHPSGQRWERFYELAEAFDRAVIEHTRNGHLSRSIAELRPHSARLRTIAHTSPDRLEKSLREHQQMCRAILSGNGAAAAEARTRHLTQTQHTILDSVVNHDRTGRGLAIDVVTA